MVLQIFPVLFCFVLKSHTLTNLKLLEDEIMAGMLGSKHVVK